MKYLTQLHEKGLAIITWFIDEDYQFESDNMMHQPDCVYYHVYVDIFDSKGILVHEDCISGIDITTVEATPEFKEEILNCYQFYFATQV